MIFFRFLKDWSLPIAMITGAMMYLLYVNIPFFDDTHKIAADAVAFLQPALIFLMLFVTFCKIKIKELRPVRWHFILLALQMLPFFAISLLLAACDTFSSEIRVLLESFMVCILCPTATAAAVITARLGGNSASLISYTMLINMSVALFAPFFLTLAHPVDDTSFTSSFLLILGRVFPLLLCPLLAAELLRRYLPQLHNYFVTKGRNIPFYIWLVALSLAIAMTARAIAHTNLPMYVMAAIAFISFVACILQFFMGWLVGGKYGERVTAGQALGQKNTVFAIWLAYTFLNPVTAIAGGFYSLWHNSINTWQLYRYSHKK
ncbi:MAG: transporter [Bacteroidaceae bacterium]|nr:transporter [Bacteroidaceae bacterium]